MQQMQRADPVEMRKALVAADSMRNAGILFVPMPVLNKDDYKEMITEVMRRLDVLEQQCEGKG